VTGDELRALFLSFFEGKGHKIIPSSSLIPQDDPTLLLTSAGMVQIKPYFLGELEPPSPRLASCQKCFRTTDIERVGDTSHLTFFEMLGNFSVGDYFKKETVAWAWEFITQHLGLPEDRLWATIFLDDDDAFNYWRETGMPADRILRFGEEDNFWGPAGDSGPCGPDSEIFYDLGEEVGCGKPSCAPNCGCDRFIEIGTLVFMQYNQDKDGNRTPLPRPSIDTGMGIERNATVVQGKTSVYETDLFAPLLECVSRLSGKKYGTDKNTDSAMRIVTEHSRGITFLIGDGVMPSNEGRGYVLRRLLRRAALFGRRLGLNRPFLKEMAELVIEQMAHVYPEIKQRQEFILKIIEIEETRFGETLNSGLELIENIMAAPSIQTTKRISGEDVFRLYDTYGFPVELTSEIGASRNFSVDLEGFDREMDKQRQRAKAVQKFGSAETVRNGVNDIVDIKSTPFVGYSRTKQTTEILSLLLDGDSVRTIDQDQEAGLILAETPFYGEMGGQVGDTGEIRGSTGIFKVTDTLRIPPDIIIHQGHINEGSLTIGDAVEAEVDGERRLDIARNHTATHLLQSALRQVLGEHVQQGGSLVAPDQFRFDFSHLIAMTPEEIEEVQHIVNQRIRQNLPVYDEEINYKKAIEEGAIALFDEKYGDIVRVLKIGQPSISTELCGGTHVSNTGEIGFFKIISESSIGSGLRRIEAVTGRGAEVFIDKSFTQWREIALKLGATPENVAEKVDSTLSALDIEQKNRLTEERKRARKEIEYLLTQVEETDNGVRLVSRSVDSFRPEVLREMTDVLKERLKSVVVVLGTIYEDKPAFVAMVTPDLVARGYNAGNIIKQVAAITGGGGGGKATLAQAGGKYKDQLDAALRSVTELV